MLTNEELSTIEQRHKERKEFSDHIPSGPYFYDSFAYVHNDLSQRPQKQPKSKLKKVGVLVRSQDWFNTIDMDANLGNSLKEYIIPCRDLGEYIALVCTHPVEEDLAMLLAEVRRLRVEQEGQL